MDGSKFVGGSAVVGQTSLRGICTLCDVDNEQSAIGIHGCSWVTEGHSIAVPGDDRGRVSCSCTVEGQ